MFAVVIFIVILVGIPVLTWLLLRMWPAGSPLAAPFSRTSGPVDAKAVALAHLRRLNCVPEEVEGVEPPTFRFEFQGGSFILRAKDKEDPFCGTLSVSFFNCMEISADYIPVASVLCNMVNDYSVPLKATYATDGEDGVIRISLHCPGILAEDSEASYELLRTELLCCFHMQREMHEMYEKLKAECPSDVTRDRLISESVYCLLRSAEALRPLPDKLTQGPALTVGEFASVALGLPSGAGSELADLTIDGVKVQYGSDAIGMYRFLEPLRITGEPVALTFRQRVEGGDWRTVIIAARLDATDVKTRFARVDAMVSGFPSGPSRSSGNPELEPGVVSVVVGLDASTEEMRKAEAEYMASEDPRLKRINNPDLSYALYWGMTLFAGKRYYEAVTYLGNAYSHMSRRFARWGNSEDASAREQFRDVIFALGLCFMALKRYERAYYFFDQLMPMRRTEWAEAYVKCLVALNDSRTFDVIDNIQEWARKQTEAGSAPDPAFVRHLEFLDREQVTLLVKQGEYDAARVVLDRILTENPDNRFAVDMLAIVEHHIAGRNARSGRYNETGGESPA